MVAKTSIPVATEESPAAPHPQQPVVMINGVKCFKENKIASWLLQRSSMNELAALPFSNEDRRQFAQLIGYSVSGYLDLSYTEDEIDAE